MNSGDEEVVEEGRRFGYREGEKKGEEMLFANEERESEASKGSKVV